MLPSTWTGSETQNRDFNWIPSVDVQLPQVTKSGKIIILKRNSNPIFIQLSDGTKAYFSFAEFNRIKGSGPEIGKHMTIVFQRRIDDKSRKTSQIIGATVQ